MKYLSFIFLLGCSSDYTIKGQNRFGELSLNPSKSSFIKRETVKLWDDEELIIPKDLKHNQKGLSHIKIQSFYSFGDVLSGLIPFNQRRTFYILTNERQED